MIGLLFSPLGRALGIAAVVLGVLGAVYFLGGRDARDKLDDARREIDTHERIDDATSDPRSPDDIIDRLRGLAE